MEIYQNCKIFNDGVFEYATDKSTRPDNVLYLEHGKPMIYGKDRTKGIRLNGLTPEVVEVGKDCGPDDLLIHDEHAEEPTLATLLSRMTGPEFPEPVGGVPGRPPADLRGDAEPAARRRRGQEGAGHRRRPVRGRGHVDGELVTSDE